MTFWEVLVIMGKLTLTTAECFVFGYVILKAKREIEKLIAKHKNNA